MAKPKPGGGTPAVRFLESRKAVFTLHTYAFDDTPGEIAEAAARQLGVALGRLLKCLIAVLDDGRCVSALIGGDRQLDLKALARAGGARKAEMAPLALAERLTGYVKGGISPFGQRKPSPVYVDAAALTHPTVYVNGGRRGLQIELTPGDLIELTSGTVAEIGKS